MEELCLCAHFNGDCFLYKPTLENKLVLSIGLFLIIYYCLYILFATFKWG